MNKSIREIKKQAKTRVNSNFGDSFIIVFVPFFIMNAFNILLSQITKFLPDIVELYSDLFINVFLNIFATYLAFKLLIQHVRSHTELTFNNFFNLDNTFMNFVFLRLLVFALFFIAYIPAIPVIIELFNRVAFMVDYNAIEGYLQNSTIIPRLLLAIRTSTLLLIGFWLLTVRFQMVPFIIIDKKMGLLDALKYSFKITKGNYFKILIYPFTYILWLLLIFTFIGAFYVIPLIFVGYGYLYLSMADNYED